MNVIGNHLVGVERLQNVMTLTLVRDLCALYMYPPHNSNKDFYLRCCCPYLASLVKPTLLAFIFIASKDSLSLLHHESFFYMPSQG